MDTRPSNSGGKQTDFSDIHSDIIQAHILTRLDGSTLASTACVSRLLLHLCRNEKIWRDICNSTWTSTKHPLIQYIISTFPDSYRSFFSDSFPILKPGDGRNCRCDNQYSTALQTSELISAMDINYKNKKIYSKVDVTKTHTNAFLKSTFTMNLLDPKEFVEMQVDCEGDEEDMHLLDLKEYMFLSWIIIDPTQKRAANVSSLRPVSVRQLWEGGDIEVKYAIVVGCMSKLVEFRIVVMLGWNEGGELPLKKVTLQVMDMDNKCLSGKRSLKILQEIIQSGKRKKGKRGEETETYRQYVDMNIERREGKQMKTAGLRILASLFLVFLALALG